MLRNLGYHGLSKGDRLVEGIATLEKLSRDRRRKIRAVALEARDEITEISEYERVRAEFPWTLNFDERYLKQALALLDEDRPAIHRCLCVWSRRVGHEIPRAAVAKLKLLTRSTPDVRMLLDRL